MATRYWVGGSGNWDATTTTNWATTSGGAGGASAPTSADDVVFDANSNVGTSAFTVTVTGTSASPSNCANFSTSALDGAMTFTMGTTAYLNCYGSWTLPATNFSVSSTGNAQLNFSSTTTGNTITTNGVSMGSISIFFAGVGGGWTLGSAYTSTQNVTTVAGTFSTGNFNITALGLQSSGTLTRSVSLGSSSLTLSYTSAIYFPNNTNLTFNAGTSTITCSNASPTFTSAGLTFYNVSFTSTAIGTITITGANTFNNLTFAARAASGFGAVLFSTGVTNTVNGTLTLGSGTTGVARLQVRSATLSTQTTLSVATLAAITDIDFRDVVATGASAPWSGTRIGDCGNNTNITGATPRTVYWNSAASANWNGAVWSTTSGNTGGTTTAFPLAQDTVVIDNAGLTTGNTITVNGSWQMPTLDFSTRSNAATFATGGQLPGLYGDYILSSAITVTGTGLLTFLKYGGTQTITSAGITFPQPVQCYVTGGTLRINGNLTLGSTLTFTHAFGTLDLTNNGAGNYTLSTGLFSCNNSNTRSIAFGTGNITLTGSNATIWTTAVTGFSYTGTPTVNATYSGSTGTRLINNQSGTESQAISFNISAGSDSITLSGGSTSGYKNLNFTGFTGTTTTSATVRYIYGNLTISSGMTFTSEAGGFSFQSTSATQQITTNGQTLNFPITQNGVGGTVQLQDALTLASGQTYTLTNGTLDLNSKTLTTGIFSSSNSNTRSILFGTGNITLTGNAATILSMPNVTNLTVTGTPTINCTYSGSTGTRTINTGTATNLLPNINVTAGSDNISFATGTVMNSVNFTGFTGTYTNVQISVYGDWTYGTGMTTVTGTGTLNFNASSGTQKITSNGVTSNYQITITGGTTLQLQDALTIDPTHQFALTSGILDLNNKTLTCGIFSSNNSNTRSIAFGTGNITVTGNSATVISMATATGFSYTGTPTFNLTYSGSTGTRTLSANTGWAESQVFDIYVKAGSDTITYGTVGFNVGTLDFTGFTGTFTKNYLTAVYRNFVLGSGMTFTAQSSAVSFYATVASTQNITTNGVTVNSPIAINGTQTTQLQDNLTISSAYTLTVTSGTFDANNKNVTTGIMLSTGTNTRGILMGSGTWTLTGVGTVWNATSTANVDASTSLIIINASGNATFSSGVHTYNSLTHATSYSLSFTGGSNTWNSINNLVSPTTFTFAGSGSIQTVTNFNVNGTPGKLVIFNTSIPGTQGNIRPSGIINVSYLSIQDINVSGSVNFNAFNSIDLGDNSGINFIRTAAARLTNDGTLYTDVSSQFDEVSSTNISVNPTYFYADEFDEVAVPNKGKASFYKNGLVVVDNYLDEITGIN